MKVLFVTHCLVMAGANRSMFQLMIELRDNYSVTPCVLLPTGSFPNKSIKDYLSEAQIRFWETELPFFKQHDTNLHQRTYYKDSLEKLKTLCSILEKEHFDLIHSNSSVLDFGGYISRLIGVRHIWHLRDFGDLDYGLYSIWGREYEKETYKNGDAFIAISEVIKNHFSKNISLAKIFTIYNGILHNDYVPLALHENETIHFFCAGVICQAKNQLEIVKAVNLLVGERGLSQLHLTIVGHGGGDYLESIKRYVSDHKLFDYVTILGEVDGIESLASTMDVGIMSSTCEAFGRVTVEYMFQNLAVIANDSGANKEIITDNETGLIYHQGSYSELADKMQTLIQNKSLLVDLAKKGRQKALENFLSTRNTAAIFDLYQKVLQKPAVTARPFFMQNPYRQIWVQCNKDLLSMKLNRLKHRIKRVVVCVLG